MFGACGIDYDLIINGSARVEHVEDCMLLHTFDCITHISSSGLIITYVDHTSVRVRKSGKPSLTDLPRTYLRPIPI